MLIIALMATFLFTCPNTQLRVQHWLRPLEYIVIAIIVAAACLHIILYTR